MSKLQRAIEALNECADALDALPPGLRRMSIFGGPFVKTETLLEEAVWLKQRLDAVMEAVKEVDG